MTASSGPTHAQREALRRLIRDAGILYDAPGDPVIDRAGRSAPWMFYSWRFSLTGEGACLASDVLLAEAECFKSRQLATFGLTAVPLLSAMIARGAGRYSGIVVREAPKGSAQGRQIEGPADRTRPVLLIDDSLSSGHSARRGIVVLESKGFTVEGVLCLVRFPGRHGAETLRGRGYRVKWLYDIYDDIGMPRPRYTPSHLRCGEIEQDEDAAPEGLPLADVARLVARHFLVTGRALRAPQTFSDVAAAPGGLFVSLRERATDLRIAREGFWHFEGEDCQLGRDLVLATIKTMRAARVNLDRFETLKVGVSVLGPLEACRPADLDFMQFGLVIRSRLWPTKVGGALPNTQCFTSEREQFDLALRNAGLGRSEPYELYRHSVEKHIETGASWLPYGARDHRDLASMSGADVGNWLAGHVRQTLGAGAVAEEQDEPIAIAYWREAVHSVCVTLYGQGVLGCAISSRRGLEQALAAATSAAVRDERFSRAGAGADVVRAIGVTLLHTPENLGRVSASTAARKLRLGRDALHVVRPGRQATFLESVAVHQCWERETLCRRLLAKARLDDSPADWFTYQTASWLVGDSGATPQAFGFGADQGGTGPDALRDDVALMGAFLAASCGDDHLPLYALSPVTGWRESSGSPARLVHGLLGLATAGKLCDKPDWKTQARAGLRACLAEVEPVDGAWRRNGVLAGPMARASLLSASQTILPDEDLARRDALARGLLATIDDDGFVGARHGVPRFDLDLDYLPSAVIEALAKSSLMQDPRALARVLRAARRQIDRFTHEPTWGQAGWLPQACGAINAISPQDDLRDGAFHVADWCLDRQVEATGAFLTEMSPGGPTFQTAFVAEGVCAAWRLARRQGDVERDSRYRKSWWAMARFMQRLILRPADRPLLSDPALGVGAVRGSLESALVRVDQVSHTILAFTQGLALDGSQIEP